MIVLSPERNSQATDAESPKNDRAFFPRAEARGVPMAIIVCHFNFAGFCRNISNLLRFLRQMDLAGIPVYGVEATMIGQEPLMKNNRRWKTVQVSRRGIVFQKEALLNIAANLVPSWIPNIAAIDPDVVFDNPDWYEESVDALTRCPAIQPYGQAIWTDEDGQANLTRHSCALAGLDADWKGHPGFAWAFRRDFWPEVGLYPWSITGAGDTALAVGLLDLNLDNFKSAKLAIGENNLDIFNEWRKRAQNWINGGEIGYVDGDLWHEWHGSRDNRRYYPRHKLMEPVSALHHCRKHEDGWVEWTESAPTKSIVGMINYFQERKEDG